MKIKTSELAELALAWAVSTIENPEWEAEGHIVNIRYPDDDGWIYRPDTDWSQGGPIIEREKFALEYDSEWGAHDPTDPEDNGDRWYAVWSQLNMSYDCYGPTPLIAAMRCFVASKLGDEVDVPEELAK
jgi:hypothetical protein